MASATVDHRHHHQLHLESIPVVDLRLISQPELLSLSLCSSSPSPSNADTELFTPKIDRSVFNESAGSRKQTFSRLRLAAPRNHLPHPHHSSPSSKPFTSLSQRLNPVNPGPLDEESSNILSLLKSLFNIDDSLTSNTNEDEPDDDKDLVPVQIEYENGKDNGNSLLQNIPVGIVSCSGSKRKRGRPRKDQKDNLLIESENLVIEEHQETAAFDRVSESVNAGGISSCSERKRKRGRPRKEESQNRVIVSEEKKVESEIERVALGNVEAILGIEEELRRRTEAIGTEAELLEFMGGLEGEWASKSQKKRIVDAAGFGNVLPQGWKLMLFVKKRAGHVWLACSRYISPNGQQFVSCKEVSSCLLSAGELKDSSQSTSSLTGRGIGSGVKPTSENFPIICTSSEHERQAPLLRMGSPWEVQRAETIKCHKCTMTFNQQDDFICHLLSSHQGTVKSSGHGTSTNEEVIIKNGKYECQFCYELFEERSCYSSHLGVHMKNNTKKVEGSVGVLTMQNSVQPFNSASNSEIRPGFPCSGANENALVETYTDKHSYECNFLFREKTLADKTCDKQNKFCIITNNKGEVTDTAAVELNVCLGSEKVFFTAESSGMSQSSDKVDVRLALHSMEEKKREMASNFSLLAPNAEGNMFSDENLEYRHFASFLKGMEPDCEEKVVGDDPKANCANTCTRPDSVTIDAEQQNCSESCLLTLSSNEQRGNLVDYVKGASVTIDSAREVGSGCGLTSSKDDKSCVINNNLFLAFTGTLDDPESIVVSESGNNDSTIGFQTNHRVKKSSQDSESALLTLHGREQIFPSDNNAFKVSSRRVEVSEFDEIQKSSGLIQAGSHDSGLDMNILASVRQAKTRDFLFGPSSYKKTFTSTVEECKQVKGSESSLHEQSANQQNSSKETSMNKVSFITIEEPKHKVESSLIGNAHARLGAFALTGTGQESSSPLSSENWEKFAGKNNVPCIGSGTFHEPKQNKGAFEDLFCLSGSEQTQVANNLSMIHAGTAHDRSRLQDFENARNNEIMIGFGNHARRTESSMTGLTWKSDEGSVLLSGLADTSSQLLQSSGYYSTFDVMSHKGEGEMFNVSGKCSNVSGFKGLRSDSIEHMEYNILTAQTSSRSGDSKVPSYDSEMALTFDSSIWLGKEALPLLPKVDGRHQVTTLCSWCGNEFYHEAVDIEAQRNSMAVMCASCRARFSRNRDFL
ncbi:PREDICTED: uncharacterized protein LOC18592144 isoform X1 [Theobroma cacao]|uniref:Uncharacterized protein LOC18592144 isoform X1 n=1 Tax=Theobroma cacao TaxID=3641 RepID=A0AB32WTJ1_THECC|nr:PREDICTED: uncharacterized protein LOC18592144 isoform X1 [Theobroma cacao]XP_017981196.1 PREDICTED: uncharacterized protein LOC18592144 isoform X1 [Theobroma cacao]